MGVRGTAVREAEKDPAKQNTTTNLECTADLTADQTSRLGQKFHLADQLSFYPPLSILLYHAPV